MPPEYNNTIACAKVFRMILPEYSGRVQEILLSRLFKSRCRKCNLPTYAEVEEPPATSLPDLKQAFGLACGFWLARKEFAQLISAEFASEFELRKVSDDAYFIILNNILTPDDLDYSNRGERICCLCGRPYIRLWEGFRNFKGREGVKSGSIYETSIKFGSGDVKFPFYFCGEEAAYALRSISRRFKFVRFPINFSGEVD